MNPAAGRYIFFLSFLQLIARRWLALSVMRKHYFRFLPQRVSKAKISFKQSKIMRNDKRFVTSGHLRFIWFVIIQLACAIPDW